ncbi:hypothetical protein DY000_02017841 [Brassica cretica]|uniref:CTLH domain-containing protein n=1 Tax=Brassica cretica TaxID=69181 RepID=A0ABQ7CVY4_BRACR|nr:hypothetical protein DY000_02017841 [Brassica cretica]
MDTRLCFSLISLSLPKGLIRFDSETSTTGIAAVSVASPPPPSRPSSPTPPPSRSISLCNSHSSQLELASLLGSNEQLIPWHIDKLKKVVEEGNAYGALQMYKSISARYVTAQRFFSHIQVVCIHLIRRKYLEDPCVWVESNTTALNILSSWQRNFIQTFMYWQPAEADVSSTSNSRIPPEQLEQNRKDGESDDPTLRSLLEYSGDCRSEMVVQLSA